MRDQATSSELRQAPSRVRIAVRAATTALDDTDFDAGYSYLLSCRYYRLTGSNSKLHISIM